jgi:hypothetical protein
LITNTTITEVYLAAVLRQEGKGGIYEKEEFYDYHRCPDSHLACPSCH